MVLYMGPSNVIYGHFFINYRHHKVYYRLIKPLNLNHMKLFNLNQTYLNDTQFKVYAIGFWIALISVIYNMESIVELLNRILISLS